MKIESPEKGLWFLLLEIALALRQMTDHTMKRSQLSLTVGEIRALQYVMRYRSQRQVVLSERMGIEAMTLSVYLDRLEAMQLIERKRDQSDRRVKLIEPTDEAGRMLSEFETVLQQVYRKMTENMLCEDISYVYKRLEELHLNLLEGLNKVARTKIKCLDPVTVVI